MLYSLPYGSFYEQNASGVMQSEKESEFLYLLRNVAKNIDFSSNCIRMRKGRVVNPATPFEGVSNGRHYAPSSLHGTY